MKTTEVGAEGWGDGTAIGGTTRAATGGTRGAESPLLSILVVVFRDRGELEQLLGNLAPFRSPEVELVIVDGGSDDGSVDLLRRRDAEIDFWISEPDRGVYDAMNKGITAARGRFVLHINAGDRLLALPALETDADVVCCRVIDDGKLFKPRNGAMMRFQNIWHGQGTFYRKSSHLGYDTRFRVFGDFDHNQRMFKAGSKVMLSPVVVSEHQKGGLSDCADFYWEEIECIRSNFGPLQAKLARGRFLVRNSYREIKRKARRVLQPGRKMGEGPRRD